MIQEIIRLKYFLNICVIKKELCWIEDNKFYKKLEKTKEIFKNLQKLYFNKNLNFY